VNVDPRTLADRIRSMVRDPDAVGTHYDECWQWHDDCALLLAADLLAERDALRANRDVWMAQTGLERKMRNEAESRLAALTDAIGDPDELADLTTLHPAWAHVELLRRIAAAVQPPDTKEPTRRVQ